MARSTTKTLDDLPKWAKEELEEVYLKGVHLWPSFDDPEVLKTDYSKGVEGYIYNAYSENISHVVVYGCTRYTGKGITLDKVKANEYGSVFNRSRDLPTKIYATYIDAVKAMRWEKARVIAKEILALDRKIEKILESK